MKPSQAALVGIAVLGPGLARAQADLSVTKTAVPELVVESRPIEYRIVVTNQGPDEAQNVELVDDLPEEASLTEADSRCVPETPTRLRCTLGDIAANDSRTLLLEVRAPAITALPPLERTITNSANVEATGSDPVIGNNGAQVNVQVVPEENAADLQVDLDSSVSGLNADQAQFTVEVFNSSALSVDNVTTVVRLDALALSELVETEPTRGSCLTPLDTCVDEECAAFENEPLEVTCNLGTLTATGTERTVITVSTQSADDDLTATATVSSDRADPDLTNNRATETTADEEVTGALTTDGGTCVASVVVAGSPMERDLRHLRRLRDRIKRFAWGRRLVGDYYRISPALARRVGHYPRVCKVARAVLKPFVLVSRHL